MDEYFGSHPLKQFIRGKPTRFGFKVWVLATSAGELIRCEPYAGARTKLFSYGLGQGNDVVYGLVEDAKLVAGTKVACDILFTSLDLLEHMSKKGIGVVGTMRQNRLFHLPLPSKKQGMKMTRGQTEEVYLSEDKVVVVWKDSAPVYMASNFADINPMGHGKVQQVLIEGEAEGGSRPAKHHRRLQHPHWRRGPAGQHGDVLCDHHPQPQVVLGAVQLVLERVRRPGLASVPQDGSRHGASKSKKRCLCLTLSDHAWK